MKLRLGLIITLVIGYYQAFPKNDSICGIFPQKNGLIYYSEVIETNGLPAEKLYQNAKIWVSNNFMEAQKVIQTDINNTTLTIKGNTKVLDSKGVILDFTLNLFFKDGRFRYEITNLRSQIPQIKIDKQLETLPAIEKCLKETLFKYDDAVKELILSFSSKINSEEEDW